MMNKKSIIKYIALLLIIIGGGFLSAAFQDYIIEAIAWLEPLVVKIGALSFGVVFPGEELQKTFTVELAQGYNFEAEYKISHSVKPINPEDKAYCLANPTDYQRCYPNLCYFLNEESQEGEGDTTMSALLSPSDISDNWLVNFVVPPIAGFVAQGYEGLTIDQSGIFGCDIEVLFVGELLVDTVYVDSSNINGTDSIVLESGVDYRFEAMETWKDNSQPNHYIDAEYTTFDGWVTHMDGTTNWGPNQKDLQVDDSFVGWGDYNIGHIYHLNYTGTGSVVNFRIFDGDTVPQPGWYGDNSGLLTVNIYELP